MSAGGSVRRALWASLLALALVAVAARPVADAVGSAQVAARDRVVLPDGRAYVLHVPPQLRADPERAQGRPVMVFLHGLESDPRDAARSTGLSRLADRDGVLLAFPEGVRASFNAGLCCGPAAAEQVDDVGFVGRVITDLKARGAGRVSVVGFSNGGMMAYRVGCERPQLVDSVGVMSGTLEIPRCQGPVRALHLHGERDTAVPVAGTPYSERLKTFLRDVRTIEAAAPGSDITLEILPGFPHRWTVPEDAVDASERFWEFARMTDPT